MSRANGLRLLFAVILVSGAGFAAWTYSVSPEPAPVQSAAPVPASSAKGAVGCLGRLKPEGGIVRVAAPYYQSRPSVVAQLFAHEGDLVRAGQLLAYLDGKNQVEAGRARVAAQLELARARVTQARAGAKPSDLEAQRSEIASLETSSRLRDSEFKRAQTLLRTGDAAAADVDSRKAAFETAAKSLDQARHRLAAMSEVRQVDVQVAEADAAVAEAQLREANASLAALTVIAPAAGRVLAIHAHVGEQVGPDGILEIADISRMTVEAEVYASDIGAVSLGRKASVELDGGGPRLSGVVTRIGERVRPAAMLAVDPASFNDARVVPVDIRISGCGAQNCPINARVKVVIEPAP